MTSDIVQVNRTHHTGAGAARRLVARAVFDGPVEPGRDYLIVDDHVTLGGTIADLRAYIERRGGRVILASTLSASPGSHKFGLAPASVADLRQRFPGLEDWWRERFGNGFEGLTNAEARYLLRQFDSADAIRNRLAAARDEGVAGADAGAAAPGGGAGGSGGSPGGEAGALDDPRLARLRDTARFELELALRRFFADETGFGVVETDPATRRATLQGTQPGTVTGEALRFIAQFKGYPVAFTQRVVGRAVMGGDGTTLGERLLGDAEHTVTMHIEPRPLGPFSPAKSGRPGSPGGIVTPAGDTPGALPNHAGQGRAATNVSPLPSGSKLDFSTGEAPRAVPPAVEATAAEHGVDPVTGALPELDDLRRLDAAGRLTQAERDALAAADLAFAKTERVREALSPGFLARQERQRRRNSGRSSSCPGRSCAPTNPSSRRYTR